MITQFIDRVTGTAVYLNPDFVASLRPGPSNPTRVTMVELRDGETPRVQGEHTEVAGKHSRPP